MDFGFRLPLTNQNQPFLIRNHRLRDSFSVRTTCSVIVCKLSWVQMQTCCHRFLLFTHFSRQVFVLSYRQWVMSHDSTCRNRFISVWVFEETRQETIRLNLVAVCFLYYVWMYLLFSLFLLDEDKEEDSLEDVANRLTKIANGIQFVPEIESDAPGEVPPCRWTYYWNIWIQSWYAFVFHCSG